MGYEPCLRNWSSILCFTCDQYISYTDNIPNKSTSMQYGMLSRWLNFQTSVNGHNNNFFDSSSLNNFTSLNLLDWRLSHEPMNNRHACDRAESRFSIQLLQSPDTEKYLGRGTTTKNIQNAGLPLGDCGPLETFENWNPKSSISSIWGNIDDFWAHNMWCDLLCPLFSELKGHVAPSLSSGSGPVTYIIIHIQ